MARRAKGGGEETRGRLLEAAIVSFADRGFEGASTRQIATLAGENQGLITYHFGNKEQLWKEAMDRLFGTFREEFAARWGALVDADVRTRLRLLIYFFVRYAARHPEQMRLMVQEGKSAHPRTQWLVERHIEPMYQTFGALLEEAQQEGVLPRMPVVHAFYILIGASSLIFAHGPECEILSGRSVQEEALVEGHAQALCSLLQLDAPPPPAKT